MVVRRCCGFVILMVLFLYRMVRGRGGELGIEKYEILCIFIFFIIDYDKCKYYDL